MIVNIWKGEECVWENKFLYTPPRFDENTFVEIRFVSVPFLLNYQHV